MSCARGKTQKISEQWRKWDITHSPLGSLAKLLVLYDVSWLCVVVVVVQCSAMHCVRVWCDWKKRLARAIVIMHKLRRITPSSSLCFFSIVDFSFCWLFSRCVCVCCSVDCGDFVLFGIDFFVQRWKTQLNIYVYTGRDWELNKNFTLDWRVVFSVVVGYFHFYHIDSFALFGRMDKRRELQGMAIAFVLLQNMV